jgi:hypothetical protein
VASNEPGTTTTFGDIQLAGAALTDDRCDDLAILDDRDVRGKQRTAAA